MLDLIGVNEAWATIRAKFNALIQQLNTNTIVIPAADEVAEDGPYGTPLYTDSVSERSPLFVNKNGEMLIAAFERTTQNRIADAARQNAAFVPGLPGYNHRNLDDSNYLITLPSMFGPVDVVWPKNGSLPIAASGLPIELLSFSGQSNVLDGGDSADIGFQLVDVFDKGRCFRRSSGWEWGDGVSSAPAYAPGDLTALSQSIDVLESK